MTSLTAAGFDPMASEMDPVVLSSSEIEAQAAMAHDAARAAARAAGRDEDDLAMDVEEDAEGATALTRTATARATDRRRAVQARADADAERDFEDAMAPGAAVGHHAYPSSAAEGSTRLEPQQAQHAYDVGADFEDVEEDPYSSGMAGQVQSKKALAKRRRKEKARALLAIGGAGAAAGNDSDPDL